MEKSNIKFELKIPKIQSYKLLAVELETEIIRTKELNKLIKLFLV